MRPMTGPKEDDKLAPRKATTDRRDASHATMRRTRSDAHKLPTGKRLLGRAARMAIQAPRSLEQTAIAHVVEHRIRNDGITLFKSP